MSELPAARQTTELATYPDVRDNPRYIVHHGWHSPLLGTSRSIFVYLPEAYSTERNRLFPVLLMHDGQNLFDGNLSHLPGQTWRAHLAADEVIHTHRSTPAILIGIANMAAGRIHEYTPQADSGSRGGGGLLYLRHIVEELLPELRRLYRISPRREDTAIAGSSLGALISLYAGLYHPEIFGAVGALSPSLWWNNRSIFDELDGSLPAIQQRPRIWLDTGSREGGTHLRDTASFARALQRLGWRLHEDLEYKCVEGAGHTESDWAARLPDVLPFLFPSAKRP